MKVIDTEILVVSGSLIDQDVECIVNAANMSMRGGGGIDGAIHKSAGPALLEELRKVAPDGAPTAKPVLTHGHNLKQPWIIHVAGPIYNAQDQNTSENQLDEAYTSALVLAHQRDFQSIGFCSISTGVYRFPLEKAAEIAFYAVQDFINFYPDTTIKKIVFAMFQPQEFEVFDKQFKNG